MIALQRYRDFRVGTFYYDSPCMYVAFQFTKLMELLHDMLEQIERQRLAKMVNEIPDHDVIDSRSVVTRTYEYGQILFRSRLGLDLFV